MNALAKKLQLKPGYRVLLMNAPQEYPAALGRLPEEVSIANVARGRFDLVHLFVRSIRELERFGPKALKAVQPDGLLWISYLKKSSQVETDISRDVGWNVIAKAGWRPVTQIAIDDVWSALRFRPREKVGAR